MIAAVGTTGSYMSLINSGYRAASKAERDLNDSQNALSSGTRVNPRSNTASYVQASKIRSDIVGWDVARQKNQQFNTNIDLVRDQNEYALDQMREMRNLLLKAADTGLGTTERQAYADQFNDMQTRLYDMFDYANSSGASKLLGVDNYERVRGTRYNSPTDISSQQWKAIDGAMIENFEDPTSPAGAAAKMAELDNVLNNWPTWYPNSYVGISDGTRSVTIAEERAEKMVDVLGVAHAKMVDLDMEADPNVWRRRNWTGSGRYRPCRLPMTAIADPCGWWPMSRVQPEGWSIFTRNILSRRIFGRKTSFHWIPDQVRDATRFS